MGPVEELIPMQIYTIKTEVLPELIFTWKISNKMFIPLNGQVSLRSWLAM